MIKWEFRDWDGKKWGQQGKRIFYLTQRISIWIFFQSKAEADIREIQNNYSKCAGFHS